MRNAFSLGFPSSGLLSCRHANGTDMCLIRCNCINSLAEVKRTLRAQGPPAPRRVTTVSDTDRSQLRVRRDWPFSCQRKLHTRGRVCCFQFNSFLQRFSEEFLQFLVLFLSLNWVGVFFSRKWTKQAAKNALGFQNEVHLDQQNQCLSQRQGKFSKYFKPKTFAQIRVKHRISHSFSLQIGASRPLWVFFFPPRRAVRFHCFKLASRSPTMNCDCNGLHVHIFSELKKNGHGSPKKGQVSSSVLHTMRFYKERAN